MVVLHSANLKLSLLRHLLQHIPDVVLVFEGKFQVSATFMVTIPVCKNTIVLTRLITENWACVTLLKEIRWKKKRKQSDDQVRLKHIYSQARLV